jgi:hypothetical protein
MCGGEYKDVGGFLFSNNAFLFFFPQPPSEWPRWMIGKNGSKFNDSDISDLWQASSRLALSERVLVSL